MFKKLFLATLVLMLTLVPAAQANHPAPTGLTVTGTTTSSVLLDWNNYSGLSFMRGYRVVRYNAAGTQIDSRVVSASALTWTGLAADTTYQFAVQAVSWLGHSTQLSARVTARTQGTSPPPPPPPPPPVDTDGDGVPDMNDQCPGLPGPAPSGCPQPDPPPPPPPNPTGDADGDGVFNANDRSAIPGQERDCSQQAGPRDNNGCPAPTGPVTSSDPDGDTFAGSADFCPNVRGHWPDGCRGLEVSGGGGDSGEWEAFCQYSHSGMHDAIVAPGVAAFGHLHQFVGNTGTVGASTNASLRAGGTNCVRDPKVQDGQNKSAYWVAALMVDGQEVLPRGFANAGDQTQISAKYMLDRKRPGNVQPFPEDYKIITGVAAGGPQVVNGKRVYEWTCMDGIAVPPHALNMFPTCNTPRLRLMLHFPDCSDGRSDSPNHRDHATFSLANPEGGTGICPASHPIELPMIRMEFRYATTAGPNARLSTTHTGGDGSQTNTHGDFMNGWDMNVLRQVVHNCMNRNRYCGSQNTPVLGHG